MVCVGFFDKGATKTMNCANGQENPWLIFHCIDWFSLSSPQKYLGCSPWFKGQERENVLKQGFLYRGACIVRSIRNWNIWFEVQFLVGEMTNGVLGNGQKKWIIYRTLWLYFPIKKKVEKKKHEFLTWFCGTIVTQCPCSTGFGAGNEGSGRETPLKIDHSSPLKSYQIGPNWKPSLVFQPFCRGFCC